MIQCRGKNGWFNLHSASAKGMSGGEVAVSMQSKAGYANVAPIYFSGPKEEVLALINDLKEQVGGTPSNRPVTDNPAPTIEECAEIGRRALVATCYSTDPDELATSIYDLVADLLHLARLNDIDTEDIIHTAQMHFDAEVEEEKEATHG